MWTTMVPLLGAFLSHNWFVPVASIAVAVGLLLFSLRRRQRELAQRSQRDPLSRNPPRATESQQLGRDLEALVVELEELSRQISAQIDTRFAKLEAAIRDADRRIAVLRRLTHQDTPQTDDQPDAAAGEDARHGIVYELADAGLSPVEIARELGKTPGEVELILKLRKSADKGLP